MNVGLTTMLSGIGLGAILMYILDPDRGNRRRAILRDKLVRAAHKTGDAMDASARDLSHRARGMVAEARSRIRHEPVADDILVERVRAKLGRVVSHPGSIDVTVHDGRVALRGPILHDEVNRALATTYLVRGVRAVDNQLEVHAEPGDVPGLQGGRTRPGMRTGPMQRVWPPAMRLLAVGSGGILCISGLLRRDTGGAAMGITGLGLLARGLTNLELRQIFGIGAGPDAIDVRKTISVAAPADRVFGFWSQYENFPRFMSNVREVRDLGGGRSRWVVSGPGGVPVEWEAEITERIPDQRLAWRTLPGSTVDHTGHVHFESRPEGTTAVHAAMSYTPPAGAAGHGVATLLGSDPKRQLDEDLLRMKTLIETGRPPHDAAPPSPPQTAVR
jgi:uncharacterized membrane protein